MHGTAQDLDIVSTETRRGDGAPWAVALNASASSDDISLTLLALAIVDDVIQVSGLIQVAGRADVRLTSIPVLRLASSNGLSVEPVRAHVLPTGATVWVSWTYQRPSLAGRAYEARIDQIDLVYRAGRVVNESLAGPWVLMFEVPG